MKNIFLAAVFTFIGIFTAQAQWYIGGGVKASFQKESQSFTLAPDGGYSFENVPLSLGCAIEYGGTRKIGEAFSHSLTVSPYLRYTICEIGERFSFFTDLTADIDALQRYAFCRLYANPIFDGFQAISPTIFGNITTIFDTLSPRGSHCRPSL